MLVEGQLNITGYKYLSQEMPPTVSCDLFILFLIPQTREQSLENPGKYP